MRFSCSQLFGMAPGEDGKKAASFRKLHGIPAISPVHGHVHSEGGMWAWQVTLGVHFLGIPPEGKEVLACVQIVCAALETLLP